jgi:fumarate hydratase class II
LTPQIGYDKAAALVKKAYETGQSLKEVLLEEGIYSKEEAEVLLNPVSMLGEALP